ncbi:imidazolonepropionase-like amidohydrolase [Haloactinopolyspora alba]|uniref:Imidazolonepropionase-like amidohydrolase n=1 Tax=Haloactinopolyspora alba TaxID=648780 RepID=A0A2P8DPG7_9ACTN|nr:amidohydrolase family protein [Haloactinopolyspora alba]PSK99100.1 imidazolonepropionase-like amidohydrolase [Haloactinopolyspora alba]
MTASTPGPASGAGSARNDPASRLVVTGGDVFDGTGAPPRRADVAVQEGRIVAVGSGLDGDVAVDATGMTVLPGLIDCHVHVMISGVELMAHLERPFSYAFYAAIGNLAATLDRGVTTVRDAGGADLGVKKAVEDGLVEGPRLRTAVSILGQTGGHTDGWHPSGIDVPLFVPHPGRPDPVVDGPDEMRRRVRQLIRAGADVIKICTSGGVVSPRDDPRHPQFGPDELAVCTAEAAAAGIFVMAHAQGAAGIKNAVRAGVRSVEHGMYLDDEAIEMMLEAGTFLVPTLVAPHWVIEAADAGAAISEVVVAKAREVAQIHQESVSRAVAAGVPIAMGTDSGVGPHGQNLRELELMRRAGMQPAAVLAAATSAAARLIGVADELGTVEPGNRADLVLVGGDPYDFAALEANIRAVYKGLL